MADPKSAARCVGLLEDPDLQTGDWVGVRIIVRSLDEKLSAKYPNRLRKLCEAFSSKQTWSDVHLLSFPSAAHMFIACKSAKQLDVWLICASVVVAILPFDSADTLAVDWRVLGRTAERPTLAAAVWHLGCVHAGLREAQARDEASAVKELAHSAGPFSLPDLAAARELPDPAAGEWRSFNALCFEVFMHYASTPAFLSMMCPAREGSFR
jgi:hypothetical protein